MFTTFFVAATLAVLPVFVVAMALWWQALAEPGIDGVVDPRFQDWASDPTSTPRWADIQPARPVTATAAR